MVGQSYGGEVISNAGYNNPNVTGLVYVAAFAPDEGQSLSTFVNAKDFPQGFLILDSAGLAYINPAMFHDRFAQDVKQPDADIMVVAKSHLVQQFLVKNPVLRLGNNYQHGIRFLRATLCSSGSQHNFAKQMNATTISINASHASYVSHPDEIAKLILDAVKGSTKQVSADNLIRSKTVGTIAILANLDTFLILT